MDLPELVNALSQPTAYPYPVDQIEVRQTHLSVVFRAGDYVFKIKKPVDLGFVDFTSLEKRHHDCQEEIRLNRRLAPDIYRGVVPVVQTEHGLKFGGAGQTVEWAVQMERLPDDATLLERVRRGEVTQEQIEELARRIARFHAEAATDARIAAFGRFEAVARNLRDNLQHPAELTGKTVSRTVLERLKELTEETLARLQPLIEARAARGMPRDTHGDLHLDHVYLFPERQPPADLIIIDCIEFNERLRYTDPVADMAFVVMDLGFQGRHDLASAFADAYFEASRDDEGRALLTLYTGYRAMVRGKVEGLRLLQPEVEAKDQAAGLLRSRAYWLLALGELETPQHKPCLVLTGGVPGSGKSTLARGLAERANFQVVRSDVVRKELAGIPPTEKAPPGMDIYDGNWTDRTYAECLRRAEAYLFEGKRVIVDATFSGERRRQWFLQTAAQWAVPAVLFFCQASPETLQRRLAGRQGDASDADWSVSRLIASQWQAVEPETQPFVRDIDSNGSPDEVLQAALADLGERGLVG